MTTAFAGSIPDAYQSLLVPLIFEDYARSAADRIPAGSVVLETACGTGVVTRHLHQHDCSVTATDVSPAMLEVARRTKPGIEFREADACDLPFGDGSFDAMVNQFGVMFVPDEQQCYRETARVLRPGGTFVVSIWDTFEKNPLPGCVHSALRELCPDDPPGFLETPFAPRDLNAMIASLQDAGFGRVVVDVVPGVSRAENAESAARAFLAATPLSVYLNERGLFDRALEVASAAVGERFGAGTIEAPMQAIIVEAERR